MEAHQAYVFVHGDICDEALVQRLFSQYQIDTVAHFAAESHVDRSINGPDEFVRTNIVGTHVLLKSARQAWQQNGGWHPGVRFHHVSTDEVYGSLQSDDAAFTETVPYAPNSPYSASKAASDHLVRAYHHTYGMPVTTSNCSNNYGPYHFPEKLIPLVLVRALDGEPLPIYGRGENVRDWLYVADHCRGIQLVIERGRPGETYNIGGCNEWRNIDIVRHVCLSLDERFSSDPGLAVRFPRCPAALGLKVETLITYVTDRAGHDWRYAINPAKIEQELGFRPRETFLTGMDKTIQWYLDNETWWRTILNGTYR
jgi:dTDP-glucose 4,6-dehydratase